MLIHGECLEEMDKLIAQWIKVDAIIADIPYWSTHNKRDVVIPFGKMWDRLNKLIKPNGAIVLFWSEPFSSKLRISNLKNYKYDWIWDKVLKTWHLNSKIMPMGRYENICVFWKWKLNYYPIMEKWQPQHTRGQNWSIASENYGKQRTDFAQKDWNTLKYPSNLSIKVQKVHPSKCKHPTEKPVELMEYLIKTYTREWEMVLDFTFGAWSTLIAAKKLKRKYIGIEINEEYFRIAEERLNEKEMNRLELMRYICNLDN